MLHARRSFRGRSKSQMRKKTWSPFEVGGFLGLNFDLTTPSNNQVASFFVFTPRPDVEESTILRTHLDGYVDWSKTTSGSGISVATAALGLAIVTFEAANGGSIPNPATSEGASWDGWYTYWSECVENGSTGFASTFIEPRRITIDSKAMRKLESGNVIVVVGGFSSTGTAPSGNLTMTISGRQLLMLP